jgi:hypothetical protein
VTVTSCTLAHNQALGGSGGAGGNGLGGGLYIDDTSQTTLSGSRIVGNQATGGDGGQGVGGGVYIVSGGQACKDLATLIVGNHASTSDDDVFGTLNLC